MRCLALILLACCVPAMDAQEAAAPPQMLLDAAHCLVTAQGDPLQLAPRHAASAELGYVADPKSLPGATLLTVVNYTIPTHARGTVFTFVVHGNKSHRALQLQYSVAFRQSDDGSQKIDLVDPPFGGIATQDEAISAIRRIGFHTFTVSVSPLLAASGDVQCESQAATLERGRPGVLALSGGLADLKFAGQVLQQPMPFPFAGDKGMLAER